MPHETATRTSAQYYLLLSGDVTTPFTWGALETFYARVAYGTSTIPTSSGASDLAKFKITITAPGAPPAFVLRLINKADQGEVSGTAPIFTNDELVIIEALVDPGDWTAISGGTGNYEYEAEVDFHANYLNVTGTTLRSPIIALVKHATWTGNLVLEFQGATIANAPTVESVTVEAIETAEFAGFNTLPVRGSRHVRDMLTGLPAQVDELSENQYHKGIWTVGSQVDPDDPRNIRPTPLPDSEGERGDDTPAN